MSDGVQQQPQENLTGSDQISEQTQDEEEQEISEASGSVSLIMANTRDKTEAPNRACHPLRSVTDVRVD